MAEKYLASIVIEKRHSARAATGEAATTCFIAWVHRQRRQYEPLPNQSFHAMLWTIHPGSPAGIRAGTGN